MTPTDFLSQLLPFDDAASTDDAIVQRFLLKDISTEGLRAVQRLGVFSESLTRALASPRLNSLDVLKGYTLLDDAEDTETGRPIRDYFLWTAIARLMITAGDLTTAAVITDYQFVPFVPFSHGGAWRFGYDLIEPATHGDAGSDTPLVSYPFLTLFPVDVETVSLDAMTASMAAIPADGSVGYKVMGSIDPTQLFAKMGAYPLAVHPKLAQRSIAVQLHYLLADTLIDTGLQLLQHWQSVDTSQGAGVYYFSDGVDAYVMIYHAPILRDALIRIDAACGRTEADGAIVADPTAQFLTVPAGEVAALNDPFGTIEAGTRPYDVNHDLEALYNGTAPPTTNLVEQRSSETSADREAQQSAFGQPDYLG